MSRERFHTELADVAAGEPASATVSAHLEACPSCLAELAALRRALALADEALGEIAGAEPSPGLRARIRSAAADVPAPRPRHWAWMASAAVLTAAVFLTAAGRARWLETHRQQPLAAIASPAPSPARPAPHEGRPMTSQTTTLSHGPVAGRASAKVEPRRGTSTARRGLAQPEVLVPPGQQEALVRFVALVRAQRRAPPAFAAAGEPSADLAEPAPLVIEPLEIVPLDPADGTGT